MWSSQLLCVLSLLDLTIASPEPSEVQYIMSFSKVSIIYHPPLFLVIF